MSDVDPGIDDVDVGVVSAFGEGGESEFRAVADGGDTL